MIKKITLSAILLVCMSAWGMAQASLSGKVTDEEGGTQAFCNVVLYKNGVLKTGVQTDFEGNYRFTDVDPGKYDVQVSLVGYKTLMQTGVVIGSGKSVKLDMKLEKGVALDAVTIKEYRVPIVDRDNTTQGQTLTSEQIEKLPVKDISAIAAMTAGVAVGSDGSITMKGSRTDANVYYVDGVRVRALDIPSQDIEEFQVITGGLEAKYGDVTGGVISLTTKGPAAKLTGGLELENSKYLDPSGYMLANGNLSGPLLTKKNKDGTTEPILGFRLSGQFRHYDDPNIPAIPVYAVNNAALQKLLSQPVTYIGGGTAVASAEQLGAGSFDTLKYHPNNKQTTYDVNGKLDFRLNPTMDMTASLGYHKDARQFTPTDATNALTINPTGRTWELFNSQNNPTQYTTNYRANLRFRHRLGDITGGDKKDGLLIGNASYSLQAGYEINNQTTQDAQHGSNYFDYGYVGQFNHNWVPAFNATQPVAGAPLVYNQVGYTDVFTGYAPNTTINPVLAAYNNGVPAGAPEASYNMLNGLYNNSLLKNVWDFRR